MKKLLGILVLGLMWGNAGISGENKFTVQELNINLSSEYELEKIGTNSGDFYTKSYKNVFYAQAKEGKLVGLLETFYFDSLNSSYYVPFMKQFLFKKYPNSGCNKPSSNKYSISFKSNKYFLVFNKGATTHCVSVKILNNKEIYGPHFVLQQFNTSA